jgi:hypothetical protein
LNELTKILFDQDKQNLRSCGVWELFLCIVLIACFFQSPARSSRTPEMSWKVGIGCFNHFKPWLASAQILEMGLWLLGANLLRSPVDWLLFENTLL